ncbi:MAG: molybdopterin-binding protein, partial [Polaromonas sp.]|nr:molybdopterin-binding protein [Polaromonas sp.]
MKIQTPKRLQHVDGDALLKEAVDRIATAGKLSLARRNFLRGSLTLGGLSMLTGCMLDDSESINTALTRISRINDDVQGLLFDPNRLAPTYPDSMITRPFPFNAYYGEDEVREVEEESYRLEVASMVADRRKWSLPELRAMPQAD